MDIARFSLLLAVTCFCGLVAHAAAPPNDDFSKAEPLAGVSGTIAGTTLDATVEKGDPAAKLSVGDTVWYSFTAPGNGIFTSIGPGTFSSGADIDLILYKGTSLTALKPVGDSIGETGTSYETALSEPVVAGKKYYLCVAALEGSMGGTFALDYAFETAGGFAFVDPPSFGTYQWTFLEGANSTIDLTVGRFGSTTGTAQVDYTIQADPRLSGSLNGTLTFAPGVTRQTISLGLANQDTAGVAYLTAQLSQSSTNAVVLPRGSIVIRIEGDAGTVANDNFANAQGLMFSNTNGAVISGSVAFPYGLATTESGEGYPGVESIWYDVTAPSDGLLTVAGSPFVTLVYSGTSVATAQYSPYENNLDNETTAQVPVASGSTYYIAVDGIDDSTGQLTYSFDPNGSLVDFLSTGGFVYNHKSKTAAVPFTIIRSGAATTTATVHYATNGSGDPNAGAGDYNLAVPGVDFTPAEGTLTFGPGVTSGTFQVSILRNPKATPTQKHIDVIIDNPDACTVGASANGYIYLNAGSDPGGVTVYDGTLQAAAGQTAVGLITFTFTATHELAVKLIMNGKTYTAKMPAEYELTQYAVTLKGPKGADPLTVALDFQGVQFAEVVTGAVVDGGTTLATYSMENEEAANDPFNAGFEGAYTISLTSGTDAPAAFQAPGWALLKVLPAQKYSVVGILPDGTRFTAGGIAGGLGYETQLLIPVAIPLYGGRGTLGGVITLDPAGSITEPAPGGDGYGTLQWAHPAVGGTGAFSATLGTTVSQFAPAPGTGLLGGATLQLTIGSNSPIPFTVTPSGKAAFATGTEGAPELTYNPATGQFSGSITLPSRIRTPFSGIFLQDLGEGFGLILVDGESEAVTILPQRVD